MSLTQPWARTNHRGAQRRHPLPVGRGGQRLPCIHRGRAVGGVGRREPPGPPPDAGRGHGDVAEEDQRRPHHVEAAPRECACVTVRELVRQEVNDRSRREGHVFCGLIASHDASPLHKAMFKEQVDNMTTQMRKEFKTLLGKGFVVNSPARTAQAAAGAAADSGDEVRIELWVRARWGGWVYAMDRARGASALGWGGCKRYMHRPRRHYSRDGMHRWPRRRSCSSPRGATPASFLKHSRPRRRASPESSPTRSSGSRHTRDASSRRG